MSGHRLLGPIPFLALTYHCLLITLVISALKVFSLSDNHGQGLT